KLGPTCLLAQPSEQSAALLFDDLLDADAGHVEGQRLEGRRQLVVLVERDRPSLVEAVQRDPIVAGHRVLDGRPDDTLYIVDPDLRLLVVAADHDLDAILPVTLAEGPRDH